MVLHEYVVLSYSLYKLLYTVYDSESIVLYCILKCDATNVDNHRTCNTN